MSSGSEKDRVSEEIENGSGKILCKPKRVSLFRFRKVKNRLQKRKDKNDFNSNSSSLGCFGKRASGGGGCCLCSFRKRSNSGSPTTSDPNSAEFTHESLRGLIETNDFFSKECNCHEIVVHDVNK